MTKTFDWYTEALEGRFGEVHEGHPEIGYYRMRERKGGPFIPVLIYEDAGVVRAWKGTERDGGPVDPGDVWTYCCRQPVDFATFQRAYAGDPWPDAIEPSAIGDNGPPSGREMMAEEIASAEKAAAAWLATAGEPATWDQARRDRAQNYRERLTRLKSEAEAQRKAEKAPHLEAGKAVDAAWNPLVETAEAAAKRIWSALSAAMRAEEQRQREAQAKAIAEARAKAAAEAAPAEIEAPPAPTVKAGTQGRKVGLKEVTRNEIRDIRAVLTFLLDNNAVSEDLRAAAQLSVNKLVRAGVTVPGVESITEKVAS